MSQSSNLPSWSHFSKPQHVGTRSFVLGVLVGILIALLPWGPVFVWLAGRFQLMHSQHAVVEPSGSPRSMGTH